MDEYRYVGSELELFAGARNWKTYWSEQVQRFIAGDVLEVGAGMGANTRLLDVKRSGRWVCLEPDPRLASRLAEALRYAKRERSYETICGTVGEVGAQRFDTIIYVDVLEHIADDRGELRAAAACLQVNGCLIVVAPAHQWLFTPFDGAIGHYRRYSRSMLEDLSPAGLRVERIRYIDSVGLLASATNRLLLRQSMPTQLQLRFWDRWMVPSSRLADRLFLFRAGKTIVGVWRRD